MSDNGVSENSVVYGQEEVTLSQTIEDLVTNLTTNGILDYMMWPSPFPKIIVEQGTRVPIGSLTTHLFLDFLMIISEKLSFNCMKKNLGFFKFYPKFYSKKLPKRYFTSFDTTGHYFYVGKYEDLDVYIVTKPTSSCNCKQDVLDNGWSGCVASNIADILMEKIILNSLSKMNPVILNGRNVTISDDYENFQANNCTEFQVRDFDDEFNTALESSWEQINHTFFRTHEPKLLFTRFGQNTAIDEEVKLSNVRQILDQ